MPLNFIPGTRFDDTLVGTPGADSFEGLKGNDSFLGAGGDDAIAGGDDNDRLAGDAGTDTVYGGQGNDVISGGSEGDVLNGDLGDDAISGDEGADVLQGGTGDDELTGGGGSDFLGGGDDNDRLAGGIGNDFLTGGDGNDVLVGGGGEDVIYAGDGDDLIDIARERVGDVLYGGGGNDTFLPGVVFRGSEDSIQPFLPAKDQSLLGDGGDDIFYLDTSFERVRIDGGADLDTLYVGPGFSPKAITDLPTVVQLGADGSGLARTTVGTVATFVGIERLIVNGSTWDDRVQAQGADDVLSLGLGRNSVAAGAGADQVGYIWGERNTLDGGAGLDTLVVQARDDRGGFDFDAGAADKDGEGSTLSGFERYRIEGRDLADRATLGGGNDEFNGRGGADTARLGGGRDTATGGDGADNLYGEAGNDRLTGGAGADRLYGGADSDVLGGGAGTDQLWGGAGADDFRFDATGASPDRIQDFVHGSDDILIQSSLIGGALPLGAVAASRLREGGPVGTAGQFVLTDEGAQDRLVWDTNGTGAGGVVQVFLFTGESNLTASDLAIV